MKSQIRLKLILIGLNIAGVVLSFVLIVTIFLIPGPSNVLGTGAAKSLVTSSPSPIKTVWLIMMENTNWTGYSQLKGNPAAPYINKTLILQASHAEQYYTSIHPSLPNYLWLEAGDNLGVVDNNSPSSHHFATTNHFVTSLKNAGLTWKGYLEDISGTVCPLASVGEYVTRHNAMVYFDDVTNGLNNNSTFCIAHERPYTELAGDLQNNRIQNFNYIVPDLCHNMHGDGTHCGNTNLVTQADNWLKTLITQIRATRAYQNGGAIIINWDEGHDNAAGSESTQPLPLIVLSPFAKGGGYSNTIQYSHSSLLRTLQEIFGLSPLLCYAAPSNDLSDLFHPGFGSACRSTGFAENVTRRFST